MSNYQRLTQAERYQIYVLLKAGHTQSKVADILERNKSTIHREVRRNRGLRGYRPQQAHRLAQTRQVDKSKPRITESVWDDVYRLLKEKWSPEQISGWLCVERYVYVSHEWIYQHILADKKSGGNLYLHLRCQRQRKKRYGSVRAQRRGQIKDRVSIDERPSIVENYERVGDWEADTIVGAYQGSKPVLVTLVERKTKLTLIRKASNKTAKAVSQAMLSMLAAIKDHVLTITYDNGKEFAYHSDVSRETESDAYFAHPYHSWERGLNENTNGLIRQYFPKKTDFFGVSDQEIEKVMNALNNRPRKSLGYKTPNQLFSELHPPVALAS
jgi:IS30 family transposase